MNAVERLRELGFEPFVSDVELLYKGKPIEMAEGSVGKRLLWQPVTEAALELCEEHGGNAHGVASVAMVNPEDDIDWVEELAEAALEHLKVTA